MSNTDTKQNQNFTEEQAKILLGKRILVGITHCSKEGATVSQETIHGTIERANPKEGLVVKLNGLNEMRTVPLDVSRIKMARPGQYKLRGTEEVVEDPNYTMMLTLYPEGYKD
jgi:hypothetical protein